jgi:small subunit ribosomal protein S16
MLTIRLQRTGRTGHAQFRVIVQDSRAHPKSGRIVAYAGNYDPHTKKVTIDKDKISGYLANGAVPSERVARILIKEGLKLPAWYRLPADKKKSVRNAEKRRSTRPEGPAEPAAAPTVDEPAAEAPAEAETPPPAADDAAPAETEQPVTEVEPATEPAAASETEESPPETTEKPGDAEPAAENSAAEPAKK